MAFNHITEKELEKALSDIISDTTPGLAILLAHGDKILMRKGYGMANIEEGIELTADHTFAVASVTKQFTCLAILILKEQGLLELDQVIAPFFKDFPSYVNRVTVRQLMTHCSGIKEYFEEDIYSKYPKALHASATELLEYIKDFGDLSFEPTTIYSYCNSAYVMLGSIIEQLSGMPFGAFIEKNILKPLGMKNSSAPDDMKNKSSSLAEGYILKDGIFEKQNYNMALVGYADGNLQTTVDDLFIWHKFLFMSQDETIVKRKTINEMFTENKLSDGSMSGYGLGLFLGEQMGHKEIWHTGGTMGFVSRSSRYPNDDLSLIMLTNYDGIEKDEIYSRIAKLLFS